MKLTGFFVSRILNFFLTLSVCFNGLALEALKEIKKKRTEKQSSCPFKATKGLYLILRDPISIFIHRSNSTHCCGSGSALIRMDFSRLDPDPYWARGSESGSRKAKMIPKVWKKWQQFHALKCWMFSVEG